MAPNSSRIEVINGDGDGNAVDGGNVIEEEEEVVDLIDEAVVNQVNCCVENGHGFPSFSQRDAEVYM